MNNRDELISQISEVTSAFYKNKNNEAIKAMPDLVRKIAGVLKDNEKNTSVMHSLLEAYEQKEYVMVADILSYEVAELIGK